MTPTPAILAQLWQYADDAYATESIRGSIYIDSHATEIHVWPAVEIGHRQTCIVAIAGSVTASDWIANACATTRHGYHAGYGVGVALAEDDLQHAIHQHVPSERRVIVLGHSRGGGQAYEFALRIPPVNPVAAVVTWGAPGVYTSAAAARYPYADRTLNHINRIDPVPRLAPHLHRPGRDIPGPGYLHRMKWYKPKP